MKNKNALKVLAISAGVAVVILGMIGVWGLSKLPSAYQIKKSVTPSAFKENSKPDEVPSPPPVDKTQANNAQTPPEPTPPAQPNGKNEELKNSILKVLFEDFADPRKPLTETCRTLVSASESGFFRDPQNASAKYFFTNLTEETHDPLVESAAPVLRYMFRAPGMRNILDMIVQAEGAKDDTITKKAEFYYEIYRAGDYLKNNVPRLNNVMQQSYNLHHLAKAVAQNPHLAGQSAVLNFCDDLQKHLNEDTDFDANKAADEMANFFAETGVDPKSIGYDQNYRANVKLNITGTNLNIKDNWLATIFARDIERASQEKKPTPLTETN